MQEIVEIVLSQPSYNLDMLCDLVSILDELNDDHHIRIQEIISSWAANGAADADRALLRDKIALLRDRIRKAHPSRSAIIRDIYRSLEPSEPLHKHAWLFHDNPLWFELHQDETQGLEEYDDTRYEERLIQQHTEALREIYQASGNVGVIALAHNANDAFRIGAILANRVLTPEPLSALLCELFPVILASQDGADRHRLLLKGALHAAPEDRRGRYGSRYSAAIIIEINIEQRAAP